jgi:hypothetical protein
MVAGARQEGIAVDAAANPADAPASGLMAAAARP